MVCRGTACHVKGSASLLKTAEEVLGIKAGKTTRDGLFSLETVACMGACGLAPVISINGEFYAEVSAEKFKKIIEEIKAKEKKI
jgi:NADH-quinone oxidoreductase subunit E